MPTEAQRQRIVERLNQVAVGHRCNACGGTDFDAGYVYECKIYNPFASFAGQPPEITPMISTCCRRCRKVEFFSAHDLDLLDDAGIIKE